MRLFLSILVMICPVAISVALPYDDEVTLLDAKAFEKVLESIKPSIDAQQKKVIQEWKIAPPSVKKEECVARRERCIEMAIKGGHTNPVMETGRLYFCNTSKHICGVDWK